MRFSQKAGLTTSGFAGTAYIDILEVFYERKVLIS